MSYSFADFIKGNTERKNFSEKTEEDTKKSVVDNKTPEEESFNSEIEETKEKDEKLDMLIEEVRLLREEVKRLSAGQRYTTESSVSSSAKPKIKVHNGIAEQNSAVNENGFTNEEINSHVAGILG